MLALHLYATAAEQQLQPKYATQEFFFNSKVLSPNTNDSLTSLESTKYIGKFLLWSAIGYHSDQSTLINGLSMPVISGINYLIIKKCGTKISTGIAALSILFGAYIMIKHKHFIDHVIDHGNLVLRVFNDYASPTENHAFKFKPYTNIANLPNNIKIFGFSAQLKWFDFNYSPGKLILNANDIARFTECAKRGIVVIAAGNDKANLQEISPKFLNFARNNKRIIVVGSKDTQANFIQDSDAVGINYVKAPYTYFFGETPISGTSLGQPYVSALLYNAMQQVPNLDLEKYVEALMHAQNTSGDLNDFKASFEMMVANLSPHN